jgi:hypothetical protein
MNGIKTIGATLYWCEGSKSRVDNRGWKLYEVVLTNSNPNIIEMFVKFLRNLGIDEKRLRVQLHLYPEHNINNEKMFWSKITNVPLKQFHKVQMKKGKGKAKKSLHGICQVRYSSKELYLKIEKLIEQLARD